MRLKKDVDLVEFLQQIQKCKYDVYLETEEEDKLNLKSVLSQYLVVVLAAQQDIWQNTEVTCEKEDAEVLLAYLEAS